MNVEYPDRFPPVKKPRGGAAGPSDSGQQPRVVRGRGGGRAMGRGALNPCGTHQAKAQRHCQSGRQSQPQETADVRVGRLLADPEWVKPLKRSRNPVISTYEEDAVLSGHTVDGLVT